MWHRSSIALFVEDKRLGHATILAINQRAAAAAKECGGDGQRFSGGKLEEVMGSSKLAQDFVRAWETNLARYASVAQDV